MARWLFAALFVAALASPAAIETWSSWSGRNP
jgi:hypothetical protein